MSKRSAWCGELRREVWCVEGGIVIVLGVRREVGVGGGME